MRPPAGAPMSNYFVPVVQQGQRPGGRRGGAVLGQQPQQLMQQQVCGKWKSNFFLLIRSCVAICVHLLSCLIADASKGSCLPLPTTSWNPRCWYSIWYRRHANASGNSSAFCSGWAPSLTSCKCFTCRTANGMLSFFCFCLHQLP